LVDTVELANTHQIKTITMLRSPKPRKAIAIVLLTIMTVQTFAPATVYALTSGPTAPEYTSFEPVDTTDMVNLQTGDFTYNIPLLEVPGPEGGYPLSLSYHAGIQPDEEASWVGLGWTLNPGAINRAVNGNPDDNKDIVYDRTDYWEGGVSKSVNVGVTIGLMGGPSVDLGLTFAQDTYEGFGIGGSVGGALGFTKSFGNYDATLGISGNLAIGPYGSSNANAHVGLSLSNQQMSVGLGVDYQYGSRPSYGVNARVGQASIGAGFQGGSSPVYSGSAMGISIDSKGSVSYSAGGVSAGMSLSNSQQGKISSSTSAFGLSLGPISLGFSKTRYWSEEKENTHTYGALYTNGISPSNYTTLFDSYNFLEQIPRSMWVWESSVWQMKVENDTKYLTGGTAPSFDGYTVLAQGLSGSMRPYQLQGRLGTQEVKDMNGNMLIDYNVGDYLSSFNNKKPEFRFIDDFSNYFKQASPSFNTSTSNSTDGGQVPFDNSTLQYGTGGYNTTTGKLAGSKNINYFTNDEILSTSGTARNLGFVAPSNCSGFTRNSGDQIGGYSITNTSGVTYHYGLPVYEGNEVIQSEKVNPTSENGGYGNNIQRKTPKYAYSWLLTTMTGPDFVDRDAPGTPGYGKANEGDWGYWVNFDYGKWTESYNWRTPGLGYVNDFDNNFRNFSMGKKELYYLNSIKTRTHTAIFEKGVRKDGFGASSNIFTFDNGQKRYSSEGQFDANKTTLKLNKIFLVKNTDAGIVNIQGGTVPNNSVENYANNVIDEFDVNLVRSQLEQKSIRIIELNTDYSLSKNTPNSNSDGATGGKLTLRAINGLGKMGVAKLPPTRFEYELPSSAQKTGTLLIASQAGDVISTTIPLELGDMLAVNSSQSEYLGVVTEILGTGSYRIRNGSVNYAYGQSIKYKATKNPPYKKDFYDKWGLYKADMDVNVLNNNSKLAKQPSLVSAKNSDAWSLRKIKTPLGSEVEVEYEADKYSRDIYNQAHCLLSKPGAATNSSGVLTVSIMDEYNELPPLSTFFSVGSVVSMDVMIQYTSGINISVAQVISPTLQSINEATKTMTFTGGLNSNQNYVVLNLWHGKQTGGYGEGLRTKAIKLIDDQRVYTQKYDYAVPGSSSTSSGVISYDPNIVSPKPNHNISVATHAYREYYRSLANKEHNLFRLINKLPAPAVMYEFVTITDEIKNKDGSEALSESSKTLHQFEVLNKRNSIYDAPQVYLSAGNTSFKEYDIKTSFSRIGSLKRVTQLDKLGKKLFETTNHYLHDAISGLNANDFYTQYDNLLAAYNFQGYIKERFSEIKRTRKNTDAPLTNVWQMTLLGSQEYPAVPIGTTTQDFRSGIKTESKNLAFDLYSGAVTKSLETDANGNRFMTETVPAYTKYPDMGLKVMDGKAGNKHMLTQTAGSYVYKVDLGNNKLGLVSAQVQTWSNAGSVLQPDNTSITQNNSSNNGVNTTGNVWRKQSSYAWMPEGKTADGLTAINMFTDYNWDNPSSLGIQWKKTGEITLFNVFSTALEAMDINGIYGSTKMGYADSRVMVNGSPARYAEIAYTGGEDYVENGNSFGPGFSYIVGTPAINSQERHTGVNSIFLDPGESIGYSVNVSQLNTSKDYIVSAWVKGTNMYNYFLEYQLKPFTRLFYQIDGNENTSDPVVVGQSANGWFLTQMTIKGIDLIGKSTFTVGFKNLEGSNNQRLGTGFFDDFRFQPINAVTSSYVYDKFSGELTHVLDNNNLYTRYEYDVNGRLIKTYKEAFKTNGEKLISEQNYNYSVAAGKYFSAEINNSIQKTNCTGGQIGSFVQVYVPYGQFGSNISQQDADNQANAHAQSVANSLGTCVSVVYARVEQGNYTYNWPSYDYYYEDCDLYFRFYSDYNCTVPVLLPQQTQFKYTAESYTSYGASYSYTYTVNVSAGNSEASMGRYVTYDEYWYYDQWYQWTCDYFNYSFYMNNNGPNYIEMATYYY
jgi:hypothetical protein